MYWDINRTLSYNCLFNFVVGARGVGKSYGCKKWAIKDFIKNGNQFVYVRRFDTELKKIKKFFEDISHEFPDHEFKVNPPLFYIDGKEAGTAIALSTAKIEKSTPYPRVNKIIFDEFILDKGYHHYIPDEVTNFLELYSTIARSRDNVLAFFLSNALTMTNPYFLYFDISLPYGKNIKANGDILIEMVVDDEYKNKIENTRFGRIINNTPYGNYAIENTFLRDDNNFIGKKSADSRYLFTLQYKGEKYGVWVDYKAGLYFVSANYDSSCKLCYSATIDDHTPNSLLLKGRKSTLFNGFMDAYKLGVVRFESINIKNLCQDIIKMSL